MSFGPSWQRRPLVLFESYPKTVLFLMTLNEWQCRVFGIPPQCLKPRKEHRGYYAIGRLYYQETWPVSGVYCSNSSGRKWFLFREEDERRGMHLSRGLLDIRLTEAAFLSNDPLATCTDTFKSI